MVKIKTIFETVCIGLGLTAFFILFSPFIILLYIHFYIIRLICPDKESFFYKKSEKIPFLFDLLVVLGCFPIQNQKYDRLPTLKGSVLHIACGTGLGAEILENDQNDMVNLDINLNYLQYGIEKKRFHDFVHASAYDMPFPDKSFDSVIIPYAFHHIRDHERLIQECKRVMKNNATLIIFDTVSLKRRKLRFLNTFHDGIIWSLDQYSIVSLASRLAKQNSLAISSVEVKRQKNLLGYNMFYNFVDVIIQMEQKT